MGKSIPRGSKKSLIDQHNPDPVAREENKESFEKGDEDGYLFIRGYEKQCLIEEMKMHLRLMHYNQASEKQQRSDDSFLCFYSV